MFCPVDKIECTGNGCETDCWSAALKRKPEPEFDLLAAVDKMLYAYYRMAPRPLGPMIVPAWLPALADEHDIDLEIIAREYGFDGYEVFSDAASP